MRCKVRLEEVTYNAHNGASVVFKPVYGDTPENKLFFKYTPSGEIKFQVLNESAVEKLKVGKEYYVDFTEAL